MLRFHRINYLKLVSVPDSRITKKTTPLFFTKFGGKVAHGPRMWPLDLDLADFDCVIRITVHKGKGYGYRYDPRGSICVTGVCLQFRDISVAAMAEVRALLSVQYFSIKSFFWRSSVQSQLEVAIQDVQNFVLPKFNELL